MTFFAAIGVLVVAIPAILGLLILSMIWRAWWLYPAWRWFVVPLGLPQISFWHFVGLVFFLGVLTHKVDTKKDERKEQWESHLLLFLWPILAWAILRWLAS